MLVHSVIHQRLSFFHDDCDLDEGVLIVLLSLCDVFLVSPNRLALKCTKPLSSLAIFVTICLFFVQSLGSRLCFFVNVYQFKSCVCYATTLCHMFWLGCLIVVQIILHGA